MFKPIRNTFRLIKDILRGLNQTVWASADAAKAANATLWGGVEEAKKVGYIVKTGLSMADIVIGISHTLEDLACQDYVCGTLDGIGVVSTGAGMVLGNMPATKHLTQVTGSITTACRSIRWYCKNYGTFWGCTIVIGNEVTKRVKIPIIKK